MGLLDPNLFSNPVLLNQLKGLLGNMPISKLINGEESVTQEGLLGAMRAMPVFSPDAGQSAYDAAMNIGPMGIGKIVYHGSPHKFDKFDASKIGTGEGAQAYGHGVYLADEAGVAGGYAMAGRNKGISNFDSVNRMADRAFGFGGGDKAKALQYLDDEIAKTSGQSKKMNLQLAKQSIERGDHSASLYKADLPDEWIPKMLDWDKPISQQSKEVRAAFEKTKKMLPPNAMDDLGGDLNLLYGKDIRPADWLNTMVSLGGRQDYGEAMLKQLGVPGIRYLDGVSRGAGQGSYNYVVFPGLEDKVKILERNGVPLQGLLGGS